MKLSRAIIGTLLAVTCALGAFAADSRDPAPPHLTEMDRYQIIRGLNAEFVFVRTLFPRGEHGLTLHDGKISPAGDQLRLLLANYGAADKPGDRAQITNIRIHSDEIIFEINGGPKKKKKWYQHLEIGMGGATTPVGSTPDNQNPHGSYVDLKFDDYVPSLTIAQAKQLLAPVFDFSSLSAAEAYIDTMPPKIKQAMKNHEVLVGMNRDMVDFSKGRPDQKIRDRDQRGDYEEWIYGAPPADVEFVRFYGDIVGRVETMKVNGEKVVRTQPEITLSPTGEVTASAQKPGGNAGSPPPDANAPSLRRPGEAPPVNQPAGSIAPVMPVDPSAPPQNPQQPQPPASIPQ